MLPEEAAGCVPARPFGRSGLENLSAAGIPWFREANPRAALEKVAYARLQSGINFPQPRAALHRWKIPYVSSLSLNMRGSEAEANAMINLRRRMLNYNFAVCFAWKATANTDMNTPLYNSNSAALDMPRLTCKFPGS
ncbi:MAG: hypothetical protein OXI87_20720 [Albidovulum sp.]|nr:hypothetical protein [Albidovulum sp.]